MCINATSAGPATDGRRRKPAAGMILHLLEYWSVDLAASILIGVKERDLAAAAAAGFESFRFAKGARVHCGLHAVENTDCTFPRPASSREVVTPCDRLATLTGLGQIPPVRQVLALGECNTVPRRTMPVAGTVSGAAPSQGLLGPQRFCQVTGLLAPSRRTRRHACSCRVGPGNFTPSLSQIRT